MTSDGDPIALRLSLLEDARRFISACGIRMGMDPSASDFLAKDHAMHYPYANDAFLIALTY